MKFDRHQLDQWLQTTAIDVPHGAQGLNAHPLEVHLFDTVSSTNQTLWELVNQGADEGTVAIALQQQGGRGQWGRQWQSLPGGLYLSLALTPNLAAEQSGQLTLVSAWGIASALRRYAVPVELKWPNDLIVQGRKLGGILTETRIAQGTIHQAIVGVGINWSNPVPEVGITLQTVLQTVSSTEGVGRSQSPPIPSLVPSKTTSLKIESLEMLGAIVLNGVMSAYRQWQHQGIESILPHYQQLLATLGQPIRLNNTLGRVAGVSATGDLRVHLQSLDHSSASLSPNIEPDTTEVWVKPGTVSLGYEGLSGELEEINKRLD